jgi:RHS repeat-associated protein
MPVDRKPAVPDPRSPSGSGRGVGASTPDSKKAQGASTRPGASAPEASQGATGQARGGPASGSQPPGGGFEHSDLIPSLALPKGGGALKNIGDKFAANAFTGSGGMSIPLPISPGRDLTPALTLEYSTGAGNGPFGVGWQLSVASITRKTDRGLPTYDDAREADTFIFAGAEDLVPMLAESEGDWIPKVVESGGYRIVSYRPRVEAGFARIERWVEIATGDVHWRTWTRENVRSTYGTTSSSRIADPAHPERIFSWLLDETRDDRGNIVQFQYSSEDLENVDTEALEEHERLAVVQTQAQRYLRRVTYGNAAPDVASDWLFEVLLDYGDLAADGSAGDPWPVRQDTFSNHRSGFDVRTRRLCRRILMIHHFEELPIDPYLVAAIELTYDENPTATLLTEVTRRGYLYDTVEEEYTSAVYPPVELTYSAAEIDITVHRLDPESLRDVPGGVDGGRYRFVDLDGEGLPGLLTEQAGHWLYKRSEGGGVFGPWQRLPALPQGANLGAQRLMDLDGDGQLSLTSLGGTARGYYDRTSAPISTKGPEWEPFRSFASLPNIDLGAPNVQLLDLDGDGLADILVTEESRFVWYPSRGRDGFGPPIALSRPHDEKAGPRLLWSDPQQALYFTDMTGDGLADICRVRNGEVTYWPNLGHGRFGRAIGMRGPPVFDRPDRFRSDRLRIGDIDGSGTTDLVYLRDDGARIYKNQAGNSYAAPVHLDGFPPVDTLSHVELVDLLGKGTAALVWSTDLPHRRGAQIAYIDLMSAGKPYLLTKTVNNMGLETEVFYAPSTQFYLADREAGQPWKSRLPFPVHVIERVELRDLVAGHTFVQQHRYHHGAYDGPEREFRGFGMVETEDAESFADATGNKSFPTGHEIADGELHVPPVVTKTWFHTGVFLGGNTISRGFADEYYSDKTVENPGGIAVDLQDTVIPAGLRPIEQREAVRALRGRALRVEVFARDGSEAEDHPYTVAESNFEVRLLQPRAGQRHAAFFVHDRESLSYHYERDPANPRVAHSVTLEVDDFGNVLRSAQIAYPRPDSEAAETEQDRTSIVLTEAEVINVDDETAYRLGVPAEARTYELHGLTGDPAAPFSFSALLTHADEADEIPYEDAPSEGAEKRLLSRVQSYYYSNDLTARLSLGSCGIRALPYETLTLAFTAEQLTAEFGAKLTGLDLDTEGGYVEDNNLWWRPSGRQLFDDEAFYRPVEVRDPFGHASTITYDDYTLLVETVTDPLGNVTAAAHDYRTLQPTLVTDPNGNRQAAAFDALGMLVKVAVMGKVGDSDGDTLEDPTIELTYDLDAWAQDEEPVSVYTKIREEHDSETTKFQQRYTYSGGMGQVVLEKVQAEPGLAPERDGNGDLVFVEGELVFSDTSPDLRWIGTGRVILDNKGNPIKQYEPFFDSSPAYTDETELAEWGVTPILHYDPLGRLVRTDFPDGTLARVTFTPWEQLSYDPNDTVLDSDWYTERDALTPGTDYNNGEIDAAEKAEAHAGTPTRTVLDHLGRPFLTIEHNGLDGEENPILFSTRLELDIEGNTLSVTDANTNIAAANTFAPGGLQLHTESPDAGERWTLPNIVGNPLRAWDSRDHRFRWTYDDLNRPTHAYVKHSTDDEVLRQRTVYGESLGVDADDDNHRGQVYALYDTAGELVFDAYDFKGNLLQQTRRFASDYTTVVDWIDLASETVPATIASTADPLLDAETFETSWTFDAMSRVLTMTTPDASVTTQTYSRRGLIDALAVNVRGAMSATDIVTAVAYNARGQRSEVEYGNDVATTFEYDERSFRVRRIHTERPHTDPDLRHVQDLRYHYDPVGNITRIRDEAQAGVFFDNAYADPTQSFTYDPVYRLVEATGREHDGLAQPTAAGFAPIAHPQDTQAQRNYVQSYVYDPVGNIERMKHVSGGVTVWHRGYKYADGGNRLEKTSLPGDDVEDPGDYSESYTHDAHGSMTAMPSIPGGLTWDPQDRLIETDLVGGGVVYYVYDSAGMRVRKVWVNQSGTTSKERYYLGAWETYRETTDLLGTPTLDLERETLHVDDAAGAACLIETKTVESATPIGSPVSILRYQHHNHLGTATLELTGDAEVISYEEYHPYGTNAYRAANGAVDVSPKRYRYTGKERDEETGLYYHEARYYACWLGRWTAADPLGVSEGPNVYAYCRCTPTRMHDASGLSPDEPEISTSDLQPLSGAPSNKFGIASEFEEGPFYDKGVLLKLDKSTISEESLSSVMSRLLVEYAVADQQLYDETRETLIRSAKAAKAEAVRSHGLFSKEARMARQSLQEARSGRLRGHAVEWISLAFEVTTSEGAYYVITAPVPGGASDLSGAASNVHWNEHDIAASLGEEAAKISRVASMHTHPKNLLGHPGSEAASGRSSDGGEGDIQAAESKSQAPSRMFDAFVSPTGIVRVYARGGRRTSGDEPVADVDYDNKTPPASATRFRVVSLRSKRIWEPFQRTIK